MLTVVRGCLAAAVLCVAGCDDSVKTKLEAEAKAKAEQDKKEEADRQAALEERKKKREADFKKEEEAKAAVAAELATLCVLPEKMPKKAVGCDQVGEAHDAFVRRLGGAEAVNAWDGGEKDRAIPMTVVQCTQADSNKVAVCQKNALEGATEALKDNAKEILATCIDKYGKSGAPAAPVPKKR